MPGEQGPVVLTIATASQAIVTSEVWEVSGYENPVFKRFEVRKIETEIN